MRAQDLLPTIVAGVAGGGLMLPAPAAPGQPCDGRRPPLLEASWLDSLCCRGPAALSVAAIADFAMASDLATAKEGRHAAGIRRANLSEHRNPRHDEKMFYLSRLGPAW